jgi:hypothetical protein
MNHHNEQAPAELEAVPTAAVPKRAYSPPTLVLFGQVATLTQSGSGCNSGDNSSCSPGVSNMGVMTSDRSAKHNLQRIGTHPLGIGLYLFDYKPEYQDECGYGRQFGVMADEVERVLPEAVSLHPRGHKMVSYALLGIRTKPH